MEDTVREGEVQAEKQSPRGIAKREDLIFRGKRKI